MLCTFHTPFRPFTLLNINQDANCVSRYDLKQMLIKSPISRVPEELRKHEAAQSKPTRGQGKKIEDSSGFGGKGGWA